MFLIFLIYFLSRYPEGSVYAFSFIIGEPHVSKIIFLQFRQHSTVGKPGGLLVLYISYQDLVQVAEPLNDLQFSSAANNCH